MNLVVGATGLLGLEVCRRLKQRGAAVRGLVRDGSLREANLARLEVDICSGDLDDADSLARACRGVDRIVSTATSLSPTKRKGDTPRTVDRDGQLRLVEAARRAGVDHFIYVSVSPNIGPVCEFIRFKREVESAVRESGMAWTIFRPTPFMEINLGPTAGWDISGARARIAGKGLIATSYISLHDVAGFIELATANAAAKNRMLDVGGPAAFTQMDALRTFEEVTGTTFKVQRMPVPVLKIMSVLLRPVDPAIASILAMAAGAGRDVIDSSPVLADLPIRQTPLREYVKSITPDGGAGVHRAG